MRLEEKFKQLKRENRKAFIVYVPFGFPELGLTRDICLTLQDSGVDVIELGIPFSDPLADGPIIQKATSMAIEGGANIELFLNAMNDIRDSINIPVVIMSYYNPIFNFGVKRFLKKMDQLKISGITIVDLPLEESKNYIEAANEYNLETIFFITPTTSRLRVDKIVKASKGFIYYISVTGITGPKDLDYAVLSAHVKSVKAITNVPVCVGFGIHKREQVAKINKFSDGVVVGSEIVKFIEKHYRSKDFLKKLKCHTKSLQTNR